MNILISEKRPIEELVGANRGIVRQRIGNLHCMMRLIEVVREVRPSGLRKAPPSLRRGFVKCVADTLDEYRATYFDVQLRVKYDPAKFRH